MGNAYSNCSYKDVKFIDEYSSSIPSTKRFTSNIYYTIIYNIIFVCVNCAMQAKKETKEIRHLFTIYTHRTSIYYIYTYTSASIYTSSES